MQTRLLALWTGALLGLGGPLAAKANLDESPGQLESRWGKPAESEISFDGSGRQIFFLKRSGKLIVLYAGGVSYQETYTVLDPPNPDPKAKNNPREQREQQRKQRKNTAWRPGDVEKILRENQGQSQWTIPGSVPLPPPWEGLPTTDSAAEDGWNSSIYRVARADRRAMVTVLFPTNTPGTILYVQVESTRRADMERAAQISD